MLFILNQIKFGGIQMINVPVGILLEPVQMIEVIKILN